MTTVDLSAQAVAARLRHAAALTDLTAERRLDAKIDYRPEAVRARLRQVERLRRLCAALAQRPDGDASGSP